MKKLALTLTLIGALSTMPTIACMANMDSPNDTARFKNTVVKNVLETSIFVEDTLEPKCACNDDKCKEEKNKNAKVEEEKKQEKEKENNKDKEHNKETCPKEKCPKENKKDDKKEVCPKKLEESKKTDNQN